MECTSYAASGLRANPIVWPSEKDGDKATKRLCEKANKLFSNTANDQSSDAAIVKAMEQRIERPSDTRTDVGIG